MDRETQGLSNPTLQPQQISEIWSTHQPALHQWYNPLCPHELHAELVPQEDQTGFRLHWFIPLPLSIRDHLLALDLDENPDVLARKADQLFQSHQASSLNLLSGKPTPPVFNFHPTKARPCPNSNSSSSYSTTSGPSSTPAVSHRHQRSPSPVFSTCWFHRTHRDKAQKCKQPCSWSEN